MMKQISMKQASLKQASAVTGVLMMAAAAMAQPVSTDLGTVGVGTNLSDTFAMTPGLVKWYRFTVTTPISAPDAFADIRTVSEASPTLDTLIGLYNSIGQRLNTDDEDGPASFSALSFGAVCATRPNEAPGLFSGPAFDGRDGATLGAGTYYLAVSCFSTTFGSTNWNVTTTHGSSGSVTLELMAGSAAPSAAVFSSAIASPNPVTAGQNVLITAALQANCPSGLAGAVLTADLTNVGGPNAAMLFDDGTHGDVTAGDNTFSVNYEIPVGATLGSRTITVNAINDNNLPSSRNVTFVVQAGPAVLTPVGGVYTEIEDNDGKARANVVQGMAAGQSISGTSTGASTANPGVGSADYYRVSTVQAPLGIYRHQLALTSTTPGHTGTIRGRTQSSGTINATSDAVLQTSSNSTTPTRMVQWYGFGKSEQVYYRVTGLVATTAPYAATLTTSSVTPVALGSFRPGPVTISTFGLGYAADTDLWLYDGGLNAIVGAGNDNETVALGGSGTTNQSILQRDLAPGTYYLALSDWNLANDQSSPVTDRFRSGNVTDFPDVVVQSTELLPTRLDFRLTDSAGGVTFAAAKPGPFGVYWATFTIATPCGTADFDGDGDSGTDQDIEAFFRCLAGDCCDTCYSSDFDGDGDSGTDFDIEAFFRVLAGNPC